MRTSARTWPRWVGRCRTTPSSCRTPTARSPSSAATPTGTPSTPPGRSVHSNRKSLCFSSLDGVASLDGGEDAGAAFAGVEGVALDQLGLVRKLLVLDLVAEPA